MLGFKLVPRYRMLFIPQFWWNGILIRPRLRLIEWRGFHRVVDRFKEGNVYRVWIGVFLLTVMATRNVVICSDETK
jgi:hypothetical protein